MTEYPGFLPWHIGGDPWLTYHEIDALLRTAEDRAKARKEAADKAKQNSSRARPRRRR